MITPETRVTPVINGPARRRVAAGLCLLWLALQGCDRRAPAPGDAVSPPASARRTMASVGYLSGLELAPEQTGVIEYDPDVAWPGANFYVAGHAAEAVLMDMHGRVLHRWTGDFERLVSDREDAYDRSQHFWRRAHLFPNGDILAIHDGITMVKLDRDSNLLWEYPRNPHHDMDVREDGAIFVLTRELSLVPSYHATKRVFEDFVVQLAPDGREVKRVSVLEAFGNGGQDEIVATLRKLADIYPDITHTNSIELLDGVIADRVPAFAAGRLLLSSPTIDAIFVLDFESARVVWSVRGRTAGRTFRSQHHPTMLANGHVLFFDNLGPPPHDRSFVYEFDPATLQEHWVYGAAPGQFFYTRNIGACYRLPNGNTLIIESQHGRAFEVTPDGTIVWDFVIPHRTREDDQLIAQLFDLVRLSHVDWLERANHGGTEDTEISRSGTKKFAQTRSE